MSYYPPRPTVFTRSDKGPIGTGLPALGHAVRQVYSTRAIPRVYYQEGLELAHQLSEFAGGRVGTTSRSTRESRELMPHSEPWQSALEELVGRTLEWLTGFTDEGLRFILVGSGPLTQRSLHLAQTTDEERQAVVEADPQGKPPFRVRVHDSRGLLILDNRDQDDVVVSAGKNDGTRAMFFRSGHRGLIRTIQGLFQQLPPGWQVELHAWMSSELGGRAGETNDEPDEPWRGS